MESEGGVSIELPCGETVPVSEIDLGRRKLECDCGTRHAVVLDVHPPTRFIPDTLVETLRAVIETEDEFETFGTAHLMGLVLEEFPESVVTYDATERDDRGYALAWITEFSPRRLHEIVVELLVELMDHAMSHADEEATTVFQESLAEFDVETFVTEYRRQREFTTPSDRPV